MRGRASSSSRMSSRKFGGSILDSDCSRFLRSERVNEGAFSFIFAKSCGTMIFTDDYTLSLFLISSNYLTPISTRNKVDLDFTNNMLSHRTIIGR